MFSSAKLRATCIKTWSMFEKNDFFFEKKLFIGCFVRIISFFYNLHLIVQKVILALIKESLCFM